MSYGPELVDVLENGTGPRWWEAVPLPVRRVGAVLVVLAVVVAAVVWIRDQAVERGRAERVELVTSLSVESSSTSPPGGQVSFYVHVRNSGPLPVSVTEVEGYGDRLLLWRRGDRDVPLAPGEETAVPLSVRLTCIGPGGPDGLTADVQLRRQDGVTVTRRIALEPASLLLDIAGTLCAVRPGLRDYELSGPVVRDAAAKVDAGR